MARLAKGLSGDGRREALRKLLADQTFSASDRQRRLIEFICLEEIEGRGEQLKAYTIATQVFGRPESFDPQFDSIVRVEMGRLRRALELHYALNAAPGNVVISIPKGTYRPVFTNADAGSEARHPLAGSRSDDDIPAPPARKNRWLAVGAAALGGFAAAYALLLAPQSIRSPLARFLPAADIQSGAIAIGSAMPKQRNMIVVPIRVAAGSQDYLISHLLHTRLTETLTFGLPDMQVSDVDRSDDRQDIDLVLRTTLRFEQGLVRVSYLVIDASGSRALTQANFTLDLSRAWRGQDGELIVGEIARRVIEALVANGVSQARVPAAPVTRQAS